MTPLGHDELAKRLRRVLIVAMIGTLVGCVLTALVVVSMVSDARIESEGHLRCRQLVQARVESRHNLRVAIQRAEANGVSPDDTAIVVLRETRAAQPPKVCIKNDLDHWVAKEVR